MKVLTTFLEFLFFLYFYCWHYYWCPHFLLVCHLHPAQAPHFPSSHHHTAVCVCVLCIYTLCLIPPSSFIQSRSLTAVSLSRVSMLLFLFCLTAYLFVSLFRSLISTSEGSYGIYLSLTGLFHLTWSVLTF